MNNNFEDILKKAKSISLTNDEKKSVKERVSLFMRAHPVRKGSESRLLGKEQPVPSLYGLVRSPYGLLLRYKKTYMPIILLLALVLGGGTSYAAENALPGETLYPVKVYVNEEVRDFLAVSDKSNAEIATWLAERRLKEVEELLSEGKLTEEEAAAMEARIEKHLASFEEKIAKIEAKGGTKNGLEESVEALLSSHGKALGILRGGEKDEKVMHALERLGEALEKNRERISREGDDHDNDKGKGEEAASGKRISAERKIAEVERYIARKYPDLTSTSTPTVLITEAKALLAAGNVKAGEQKWEEAFDLYKRAARKAEEAKHAAQIRRAIGVDISHEDDDDEDDDNDEDHRGNATSTEAREKNDERRDIDEAAKEAMGEKKSALEKISETKRYFAKEYPSLSATSTPMVLLAEAEALVRAGDAKVAISAWQEAENLYKRAKEKAEDAKHAAEVFKESED